MATNNYPAAIPWLTTAIYEDTVTEYNPALEDITVEPTVLYQDASTGEVVVVTDFTYDTTTGVLTIPLTAGIPGGAILTFYYNSTQVNDYKPATGDYITAVAISEAIQGSYDLINQMAIYLSKYVVQSYYGDFDFTEPINRAGNLVGYDGSGNLDLTAKDSFLNADELDTAIDGVNATIEANEIATAEGLAEKLDLTTWYTYQDKIQQNSVDITVNINDIAALAARVTALENK